MTANRQRALQLAVLLVSATLLRTWQINHFPPGLFGDEAVNGLDALDVLAGRGAVFFPANFGREGAHIWLVAGAIRLLGVTPLAVRVPSILAGIAAVLATYWLGVELVRAAGIYPIPRGQPQGLPLPFLAALYLATSYWHIHTSRFGIRGVFTSLWAALAFAAFWRGVNTARLRWFAACGLFLGAGVHFYTASRFVPVLLVLFLLLQAAIVWLERRRKQNGSVAPVLLTRYWRPLVLAAVIAVVVVAPLGYYFLTHPGSFASRAAGVSAFNPGVSGGRPWLRMLQAALANTGQFFLPGRGDAAAFYNLAGRAVFDPLSAVLALIGLLVCLRRWRQPVCLFLLLWPPVMLLPTFVAVDRFPTLPRAQGVMPGIYFWAALGLITAAGWAARVWRERVSPHNATGLAGFVMAAALLLHAGLAVRDYFFVWGPSAAAYDAFDGPETETAAWLQDHAPAAPVYLSADLYRHPVIMFLYEHVPLSDFFTFHDPTLHWFDARDALVLPADNRPATYVFSGPAQADPAALARWLPQRTLRYAGRAPDGSPSTVVVEGAGTAPEPLLDASFTNGLTLTGYSLSATPTSGALVDVTLAWRIDGRSLAEGGTDESARRRAASSIGTAGYKVRVALLAAGRPQAGIEQLLAYRPAEWEPGEHILSFQRLALPPDAPVTGYQLAVALVSEGGDGVPLAGSGSEIRLDIGPQNGYNREP